MTQAPPEPELVAAAARRTAATGRYKWAVVGMLWFICFFNYADRQAISSVLKELERIYGFDKTEQGLIAAAFTWVYALSAPFAGQVGDRLSRKLVILGGLYVWSAITGFTALCTKVWQFVLVRGAEGLGETFYFPASMSLISDYHTPVTRSRAMSLHQTSVYAGTIGGGALAAWMAQVWGWQYPFVLLGGAGILLGLALATFIREPARNQAERLATVVPLDRPVAVSQRESVPAAELGGTAGQASSGIRPAASPTSSQAAAPLPLSRFLGEMVRTPTALALVTAFFGANLVGVIFLTWMPTFLKEKFDVSLAEAGLGATFFIQVASMCGSVLGGVMADRWKRRLPGGRIAVQMIGLFFGAPFIFLCGQTRDMKVLIAAMTLFGLFKGLYDANIWASLYDVVPASRRSTAVGLMNMIGWLGGGLGAVAIGVAVDGGFTMSQAIASTAVIYLAMAGVLAAAAFGLAPRDIRRIQQRAASA